MSRFAIKYRNGYVAFSRDPRGWTIAISIDAAYQCSEETAKQTVNRLAKDRRRDEFQIVPVSKMVA